MDLAQKRGTISKGHTKEVIWVGVLPTLGLSRGLILLAYVLFSLPHLPFQSHTSQFSVLPSPNTLLAISVLSVV